MGLPIDIDGLSVVDDARNEQAPRPPSPSTPAPPPSPSHRSPSHREDSSPLRKVEVPPVATSFGQEHVSLGGSAGGDVEFGEGVIVRPHGCVEQDGAFDIAAPGGPSGSPSRMGRGEKTDNELRVSSS